MRASLRIWILCVVIALVVYYVYLQHQSEGFYDIMKGVGAVQTGSPNDIGSDRSVTFGIACAELVTLRSFYVNKLAELRKAMQDLSGTEVLAYKLKTENMVHQYRFSDSCNDLVNRTAYTGLERVPRTACMDLASQDDPLYNTILPAYDTTNLTLYQQEIVIQDNLYTINDTIALTGCAINEFTISADDDIGTINTEELREKLNELSPYFISPGTLDFVTTYLVGNGILDTALFTSSEILSSVQSTLTFIKGIADKQF